MPSLIRLLLRNSNKLSLVKVVQVPKVMKVKPRIRRTGMALPLQQRRSPSLRIIPRNRSLINFHRLLLRQLVLLPVVVDVDGVVEAVVVGTGGRKKGKGMSLRLVSPVVLVLWDPVRTLVDGVVMEGEVDDLGGAVDKEIKGRVSRQEGDYVRFHR